MQSYKARCNRIAAKRKIYIKVVYTLTRLVQEMRRCRQPRWPRRSPGLLAISTTDYIYTYMYTRVHRKSARIIGILRDRSRPSALVFALARRRPPRTVLLTTPTSRPGIEPTRAPKCRPRVFPPSRGTELRTSSAFWKRTASRGGDTKLQELLSTVVCVL